MMMTKRTGSTCMCALVFVHKIEPLECNIHFSLCRRERSVSAAFSKSNVNVAHISL